LEEAVLGGEASYTQSSEQQFCRKMEEVTLHPEDMRKVEMKWMDVAITAVK